MLVHILHHVQISIIYVFLFYLLSNKKNVNYSSVKFKDSNKSLFINKLKLFKINIIKFNKKL